MNEITNHAELTVERKKEGVYLLKRILMIGAYVTLPIVIFLIFAVLEDFNEKLNGIAFIGIFFIPIWIFLLPKVVKPLTFKYVDIEEKMDVSGGTLTLSKILGKRKEIPYISVKVADLEAINPYRDEYKKEADEYAADRTIKCVASMKGPDVYYAYFTDENGKKTLLFFEGTEKALKVMKFLNGKTVVVETAR
ncbi:MAG: hypothetical protein IJR90_04610 [Clostridia bacterium]|nr:hypothetical protein [Clostridia bacterium]